MHVPHPVYSSAALPRQLGGAAGGHPVPAKAAYGACRTEQRQREAKLSTVQATGSAVGMPELATGPLLPREPLASKHSPPEQPCHAISTANRRLPSHPLVIAYPSQRATMVSAAVVFQSQRPTITHNMVPLSRCRPYRRTRWPGERGARQRALHSTVPSQRVKPLVGRFCHRSPAVAARPGPAPRAATRTWSGTRAPVCRPTSATTLTTRPMRTLRTGEDCANRRKHSRMVPVTLLQSAQCKV